MLVSTVARRAKPVFQRHFSQNGPILMKSVGATVKKELAAKVEKIRKATGTTPALGVILVGNRKDSESYVRNKKKSCEEVGIKSIGIDLPESATEERVMAEVKRLNDDPEVNGILVQLPLPAHINYRPVLESISPYKDVDGLTGMNNGNLLIHGADAGLIPCTPLGCMRLLEEFKIPIEGRNAVVLGRSNLVGKPVSLLLLSKNATVTLCHSKTKDLPEVLRRADILIAAIGKPEFVKGEWLKQGAVVVDVGINAVKAPEKKDGYRLVGDCHFESCAKVASAITPVPGGVGPMTVAMLLSNTVKAWKLQHPNVKLH